MTNPHHLSVLTYEQIRRLIYVMEQTIAIHGRGNYPTIYVTLKDLIKLVKSKLEEDEHSIEIRDIRLNGGAASYILSPENSHQYNDLDLIFATDLSNEDKFSVIRDVVLDCLLEFFPTSSDNVSEERSVTTTTTTVQAESQSQEAACTAANNYINQRQNPKRTETTHRSTKTKATTTTKKTTSVHDIGSYDDSGSEHQHQGKKNINDNEHNNSSDDDIVVIGGDNITHDGAIDSNRLVQNAPMSSRLSDSAVVQPTQQATTARSSSLSRQSGGSAAMVNRSALKDAYVHKMVKVTDSDRWSLISLGVHQSSPSQQSADSASNGTSMLTTATSGQSLMSHQQQQQQQYQHSSLNNSVNHRLIDSEQRAERPCCCRCCCCCCSQQPQQQQANQDSLRACSPVVASSVRGQTSSFGGGQTSRSSSASSSYSSSVSLASKSFNQQQYNVAQATSERDQYHHYDERVLQPQAPNSIELKFVDRMRRKFEFSVDSFQIILDSLILFYDCVPSADLLHLSSSMSPPSFSASSTTASAYCSYASSLASSSASSSLSRTSVVNGTNGNGKSTTVLAKTRRPSPASLTRQIVHKIAKQQQHHPDEANEVLKTSSPPPIAGGSSHSIVELNKNPKRISANVNKVETTQQQQQSVSNSKLVSASTVSLSSNASSSGCSSSSSIISSGSSNCDDETCDPALGYIECDEEVDAKECEEYPEDVEYNEDIEDQQQVESSADSLLNLSALATSSAPSPIAKITTNFTVAGASSSSALSTSSSTTSSSSPPFSSSLTASSTPASLLDVISEYFYPTVVGVSEFGDFKEALYHLENKVIATRSPEEIRGGGLLKYCNLLVRDYKPHNKFHMRALERYMCSRFFIDFNDLNQQKAKLSSYLANHFNQDSQLKFDYLNILYNVVKRSTVCLMTHELRMTLTMIRELQTQMPHDNNSSTNNSIGRSN